MQARKSSLGPIGGHFMRRKIAIAVAVFVLFDRASLRAQQSSAPSTAVPSASKQTETDEYTRYELLAPESASFKIYYEVTATTPGAKFFYNPIRKGSSASDEAVFDSMTGAPLPFEVVSGAEARKAPLMSDADADTNYIKISLARPVPQDGQGRVLILKTYKDAKSYYRDGDGHPDGPVVQRDSKPSNPSRVRRGPRYALNERTVTRRRLVCWLRTASTPLNVQGESSREPREKEPETLGERAKPSLFRGLPGNAAVPFSSS